MPQRWRLRTIRLRLRPSCFGCRPDLRHSSHRLRSAHRSYSRRPRCPLHFFPLRNQRASASAQGQKIDRDCRSNSIGVPCQIVTGEPPPAPVREIAPPHSKSPTRNFTSANRTRLGRVVSTRQATLFAPSARAQLAHRMHRGALSALETFPGLKRASNFLTRRPTVPLDALPNQCSSARRASRPASARRSRLHVRIALSGGCTGLDG